MLDIPTAVLVGLLTLGLVPRATRLITADMFPGLPRARWWVKDHVPFFGRMFHEQYDDDGKPTGQVYGCDWCVSMWVAAVVVPVAYYFGTEPWFIIGAGIAGASYVTGFLAALESGD